MFLYFSYVWYVSRCCVPSSYPYTGCDQIIRTVGEVKTIVTLSPIQTSYNSHLDNQQHRRWCNRFSPPDFEQIFSNGFLLRLLLFLFRFMHFPSKDYYDDINGLWQYVIQCKREMTLLLIWPYKWPLNVISFVLWYIPWYLPPSQFIYYPISMIPYDGSIKENFLVQ